MSDKENSAVAPSKKRAYDATSTGATPSGSLAEISSKNRRVTLGELTNSRCLSELTHSDSNPIFKKNKPEIEKAEVEVVDAIGVRCSGDQKCDRYGSLIYRHLRELEVDETRRALPDYMRSIQRDVTPVMRSILVDWLVEVAEEYKLVSDTLYLTVLYIDRFLSCHVLGRNRLQLLGVSAMLVASKYEEISPPHLEDFCYVTDNTYTQEEVVDMERDVLKFLNFEMGGPTTKTFLRIFTRIDQEQPIFSGLQFEFLGCYLAELSLLDYGCVQFLPSLIAASVIFVARLTIQPEVHPWSLELQHYSGYTAAELKECVLAIHSLQLNRKGASVRAIREKYTDHKFECVADLKPPSKIPLLYFTTCGKALFKSTRS